MGLTATVPAPPLDRLIARIWDWDFAPPAHRLERILPVPAASLIINLHEDETRVYADDEGQNCVRGPGSVFEGPHSRSFVIDTAEQIRVMGVVFRPGGAHPYFGERMDRLSDREIGLEDLAGVSARRLRERLLEAPGALERIALLEAWLQRRPRSAQLHPLVDHALGVLLRAPSVAGIGRIVADSGWSHGRFIDLFRAHVGIGAKHFARLARFHAVVAAAHRRERVDWSRIAADCGFHDQPHLVREFRAFAGMTPTAYLERQGPHAVHVPVPDRKNLQDERIRTP